MNIYTAKERRALTLLLVICCGLLVVYSLLPSLIKPEMYDYSSFIAQLELNNNAIEETESAQTSKVGELKPFDVNQVSSDELVNMGLKKSVAQTWVNYGKAIGGFEDIQQLSKIYGLNEKWIKENQDHFIFPPQKTYQSKRSESGRKEARIQRYSFDPNLATYDELHQLGLPKEAIAAVESFRKQGGTFYRKDELKYLPGVSEEIYANISSHIKLAEAPPAESLDAEPDVELNASVKPRKEEVKPIIVDVNNSTEYEWQQLKGIGPYYARNIVKYRNSLGGFSTIDQVTETYNLPDSVFNKIRNQLELSPISKPIPINSITADSLRRHPYVNWKQASIIINYRNNHGPYEQVEDLYKLRVFDTAFVERIGPYLGF